MVSIIFTYPVSYTHLIEAHFRRRQEKTEAGKMISGDIVFIAGEMKVLIKSREISLTKTELKMLPG